MPEFDGIDNLLTNIVITANGTFIATTEDVSKLLNNKAVHEVPGVKKVVHTKQGTTVVFFEDGTKAWSNPEEGVDPDPFVGFCMAVMKRLYGSTSNAIREYENHLSGGGANGDKKGKHEE